MKINRLLLIIFIFGIFIVNCKEFIGEDNMESGWKSFGKWYEWKIKTKLPKEQRDVVDYFKKAGEINDKIEDLWLEGPKTKHPKPSPVERLKLINGYIVKFKSIKVPESCKAHYEASLKYFEVARKYQEGCNKFKDGDEELLKINRESLNYDGIIFSEFWRTLGKVGLLDKFDEEVKKLGIDSKK